MKIYLKSQDNWDLPDWEEIKLYSKALIAPLYGAAAPVYTASTLATIATKKAVEKSTGVKLTSEEVAKLHESNLKDSNTIVKESVEANIIKPVVNIFGNLKLILFVVLLIIVFIKFK